MKKILVFGSLNIDYVYEVDHIVLPGETEASLSRNAVCGGKGLNQAVALARAGAAVCMAGRIGEDGDTLLEVLTDAGADTRFVRKTSGPSGHTVIQVDKNGQNSILLFGGANMRQTEEQIDETLDAFKEGDILLLQNEISGLPYLIDKAAEKGLLIVLNPSPFNARLDACDLSKVSCFILNEVEGEQLTGKTDAHGILDAMYRQFPGSEIVLTLGSAGAWLSDGEKRIFQESFPVQAVDTTAAGDTFTGYYLAGVSEGLTGGQAMRLAAKAASLACMVKGAVPSIPVRKEVPEPV